MARPLLATAALVFAGCASTFSTRVDRELPEIPSGSGVAVFSTGAATPLAWGATRLNLRTPDTAFISTGDRTDALLDAAAEGSDFPDEHGRIRMLILPAGIYCLAQVGSAPDQLVGGDQITFGVRAGEVEYVGSLYLGKARVEVRDRAERDLAVFRARNPALAGMPAVTTLAVLARTCARTGGAAEPPAKAPDFPDDPGQWSR
jgi:hypothetical protein